MKMEIISQERELLLAFLNVATNATSPNNVMPDEIAFSKHGNNLVIAVGKAAASMMQTTLQRAEVPLYGLLITREDHLLPNAELTESIEVYTSGHPIPDSNSISAAKRALEVANQLGPKDQLLALVSGGGSSMLAYPADGLTLNDKQEITRDLLACGATISEINCVRKHLSKIKGGRLATAAGPAQVRTLIISDIPNDEASLVSSGPTVADLTTLADARAVLEQYRVKASQAVAQALCNPDNETPTHEALGLAGSDTQIIARAADALDAAKSFARERGYEVSSLGDNLQAEARHLGAGHGALALRLADTGKPRVILSGGETTVTVKNRAGRGGRNLEYLLSLLLTLKGAPGIAALACDTDGIDGTEDNAGAVILSDTWQRAEALGLDPYEFLEKNDSYTFFKHLGDLVITGPTRTNVNDFRIILVNGNMNRSSVD